MRITKSELEAVAVKPAQYPEANRYEIAFAGRSNVGKSSLLNLLTGRKALARVSGSPGKTRTINFYLVNDDFRIVDLPGYGYAKLSRSETEKWGAMMEMYLSKRPGLLKVVQLVDIRHEPTANDKQMLNWLRHYDFPRLIVATNRNLEEEVQRGLFRSDLFYRLNVIRVHIPPLRQRPEDILPMAHQFLERFCKEYGKQLALSPRFVAFLEQYPWPGNVRQLENLMERLVITAQNPILDITALPLEYNSGGSAPELPAQMGTLAERMDAFEGQIIRDSYRRCGTTVAVAKELGISQATAVRKIAKYVKDRKE